MEWLRLNDSYSMNQQVLKLLISNTHLGDNTWHVNSYQHDLSMVQLPSDLFGLRVIHLVRDIRSWLPCGLGLNEAKEGIYLLSEMLSGGFM